MRSLPSVCLVSLLLAAAGALGADAPAGSPPTLTHAQAPSHEALQAALVQLRRDPNLGTQRTVRSLRWIDRTSPPPGATPLWIVGLFHFVSQAAGFLLWVAGAIGLAIALLWIYRLLRARQPGAAVLRTTLVAHIGPWDIRPDSLPADVGGAALALLDAGRTRDALSLLYRAALSRAVHRFGIPIGDSFTEGEALRAVTTCFDQPRAQYFTDLVGQWQCVVYGGRTVAAAPVRALCTGFSPALDPDAS